MSSTKIDESATRATVHNRRAGTRLRGIGAAVLGTAALALTSCSVGAPATPNPLAGGLTTRTVDVAISGATPYSVDDAAALASGGPAGFAIAYDSSSLVTGVDGTLAYDAGTGASLTLHLTSSPVGTTGSATVTDAAAAVSATVSGTVSWFTVDSLGNVAGAITEGARTVSFSTVSVGLPAGTDPALESLLADEADFCQDAQQRLAGLDPLEVPISAITNVREPSRAAFAASKSTLVPLTTHSWSDTYDARAVSGDHVTISQHINCKARAEDHVATTGVTTGGVEPECAVINQHSIDLALAQMTPAQQAAVTLPTLGTDIVRQTGSEWTTPLPASVEFSSNVLRAHSLLTRWTDPAFTAFPDTIRGVHYCTTWSPAYAYTYLLSTI